ncbi:hypothetical protein ACQ4M3_39585 [Leptolyngbya sp. AN03gr2]|uniref:hypothetical protein n=1 Tax=unclassified Leptolyngbya TaxID=2650499 RepID=UPI003D311A57
MKIWKSLLLSVAATTIFLPTVKSVEASTALPMTIATGEGQFSMTVPDTNTTKSAYGGRLRVYDVHIAKMFEVTHWMCSSGRLSPGTTWTYRADNGSIEMGEFQISCALASDIATAYGLGKSESTAVLVSYEEAGRATRTWNIPILNITGGKVDRWTRFTSNFKPVR